MNPNGLEPDEDPFEIASEYLALTRRWRAGAQTLGGPDSARRSELRRQLECALAKGEHTPGMTSMREHLRVQTRHGVQFSDGQQRMEGWMTEIAEGGMFVSTETPLEPGTHVRIELLAGADARSKLADGVVRWSRREAADGGPPGMGMAFEGLEEHEFETVVELMEEALREHLVPATPAEAVQASLS